MPLRRFFGYVLPCLATCTLIAAAAPRDDVTRDVPGWLEATWDLPVVRHAAIPDADLAAARIAPPDSDCSVTPLAELVDAEAIQFENDDALNTGGLQPAMAQALEKFRKLVASAGGSFELRSAYRPVAYQEHLQEIWFKWMRQLRRNREPGCRVLRARVYEEFTRHKLMESQMPVTDSDHSRGMAFDATVFMPRVAPRKKRRVSLDHLALLAGLRRPDIRHDPVHFKLIISPATLRAQAE